MSKEYFSALNAMKINQKQIESVLALPGVDRFIHFIKVIADRQEVWSLYHKDGWALATSDDGVRIFPLWPAMEYANLCVINEWSKYNARSISLEEFTDELLPKLKREGVLPGVFLTPMGKGITPSVDELKLALDEELKNY